MGLFGIGKNKREELIAEARGFIQNIEQTGKLPVVETLVSLKPDEHAFLSEEAKLKEMRSFSVRSSSGMGVRLMKGVYLGKSSGTSRGQTELRDIDKGTLVFTNTRIIFDGNSENRVIPMDKILSMRPYLDAVEISIENKQKSEYFLVRNPLLWTSVYQIIHATNGKIKFESEGSS